jgi:hypothetical protein
VQPLASVQFPFTGVDTHEPAEHTSVVHEKVSVHVLVLSFVKTHPVAGFELGDAGLHVSSVQAFASLQFAFTGVPTQDPALHASVVQVLLSLHALVSSFVMTHPVVASELGDAGLHTSSVHAFASSQFALTGVERQLPALHASVVQLLLSVHTFVLSFVNTQPVAGFELGDAGLHVSSVHAFESLQFPLTGVETQLPALHASVVQLLLSVHTFVLSFVITHPVAGFAATFAGLHTSSVHAFKSLQFVLSGVDEHTPVPAAQASSVQDLLSLHDATLQQNPPTQAPAAPLVSAHCVFNVHGCPGAFLYDRSNVGPFAVCVSLE